MSFQSQTELTKKSQELTEEYHINWVQHSVTLYFIWYMYVCVSFNVVLFLFLLCSDKVVSSFKWKHAAVHSQIMMLLPFTVLWYNSNIHQKQGEILHVQLFSCMCIREHMQYPKPFRHLHTDFMGMAMHVCMMLRTRPDGPLTFCIALRSSGENFTLWGLISSTTKGRPVHRQSRFKILLLKS